MGLHALMVRAAINRRLVHIHGIKKAEMASFQYINKSLINHYGGDGGRLQISEQVADSIKNHYAEQNAMTESYAGTKLYKLPDRETYSFDGHEDFNVEFERLADLVADVAVNSRQKKRPVSGRSVKKLFW